MKNENSIYIAGFFGSLLTLIASLSVGGGDAIQNTTQHIGHVFEIKSESFFAVRICITLLILLFGAVLCWIYSPANKVDAFIRGCSVLALLSLSPNANKPGQNPVSKNNLQDNVSSNLASFPNQKSKANFYYLTNYITPQEDFSPNAKVVFNEWVSSCKPSTSIWSFFFNTITICKTGEVLNKDEEIEVLKEEFITSNKGYKYIRIKYRRDGQLKYGWIYSGRDPDFNINVNIYGPIKSSTILKKG